MDSQEYTESDYVVGRCGVFLYKFVSKIKRTRMEFATDIQRLSYEPIVSGKDVIGKAKTGTGKSLAFLVPTLARFASMRSKIPDDGSVSIVIISPIKELSLQLADVSRKLTAENFKGAGGKRPFAVRTVIGNQGADEFARGKPCDLLCCTPGVAHPKKGGGLAKLLMTNKNASKRLERVKTLILDEGDALTQGGFIGAIKEIDSHVKTPQTGDRRYQLLVYSATLPSDLKNSMFMKSRMKDLVFADTVGSENKSVGQHVTQEAVVCDSQFQTQVIAAVITRHIRSMETKQSGGSDQEFQKRLEKQLEKIPTKLSELVKDKNILDALKKMKPPKSDEGNKSASWKVLVFIQSKMHVDFVHEALSNVMKQANVLKIHGDIPANVRARNSDMFRDCDRCVLVSSDASARGMDYKGITACIQIGFTTRSEYIQRAGRVGRAGAEGYACAIYDTVESSKVLRPDCSPSDDMCIGDLVKAGTVNLLRARDGELARVSDSGKTIFFDKKVVYKPSRKINVRRVYVTWLGGVASTYKRLKLSPKDVVDWAERFAKGLGAKTDKEDIKKRLKLK